MSVRGAIRAADPRNHAGDHVCVDGKNYRGNCLVTDIDWQIDTYGERINTK